MSKFSWLPTGLLALTIAAPVLAQPVPAPSAPQQAPLSRSAAAAPKAQLIDINNATPAELKALPGITDNEAVRIIQGRPYTDTHQLVAKKVLSEPVYDKIKDRVAAKQPKS